MGAPRRNRRKYVRAKEVWNAERIQHDGKLISEYGLKNTKEIWQVQSKLSNIRKNVRSMLSGDLPGQEPKILERLSKLGIIGTGATLDTLLDLNEKSFLERRLESLVYRKGLSRTMKQARQLIVHGFIEIEGKKINKPGYMVKLEEEKSIKYHKTIDIEPPKPQEPGEIQASSESEEKSEVANDAVIAESSAG